MKLKYLSIDKNHHFPVGALPLGADLCLSVQAENVQRLALLLTKDGETPVEYEFDARENFFRLKVKITSEGLYFYTFKAFSGDDIKEFGRDETQNIKEGGQPFTQLVYRYCPRPDWLEGGIVYQIFPDRFAVGGQRSRTKPDEMIYRDDWGGTPYFKPVDGVVKNNDMFGGNLRGIISKLDYLFSLGVSCIYLNPVFEAYSNHKYNTSDYLRIDGDFGTESDFETLCEQARKRGISIICDGVFSHTGDDSVYFDKYHRYADGACDSPSSEYFDWYKFREYPDKYECWWGIETLPNVDETTPSYKNFITRKVLPKWFSAGARGFRLDVADELPDEFLETLFDAVYGTDKLLIGEVWENAATKISYGARRRYLQGNQLDSVINYPLKDAIIAFVKQKDAVSLHSVVAELINDYPPTALNKLFNVLSTHDTIRILNALSDDAPPATKEERANAVLCDIKRAKQRLKLASGLQYTLIGVPCVFYGDEAGVTGFEDPFCRVCFPWGKEDKSLLNHYKRLGKLRRFHAFATSEYSLVTAKGGLYVFTRGEGKDRLTVIANAGESVGLDRYIGIKDVFNGKTFDGIAKSCGFYVLET